MGLPAAVREPWLWTEQGSPGMATMCPGQLITVTGLLGE